MFFDIVKFPIPTKKPFALFAAFAPPWYAKAAPPKSELLGRNFFCPQDMENENDGPPPLLLPLLLPEGHNNNSSNSNSSNNSNDNNSNDNNNNNSNDNSNVNDHDGHDDDATGCHHHQHSSSLGTWLRQLPPLQERGSLPGRTGLDGRSNPHHSPEGL